MTRPTINEVHKLSENNASAVEDIAALEKQIAGLQKDRAEIVESGRDDDVAVSRLAQIDARIALGASRLEKASNHAAECEKRAGEACRALSAEIIRFEETRLAQEEVTFRRSFEPWFDGGPGNKFFVGNAHIAPDKALARAWWTQTDYYAQNHHRRVLVSRAQSDSLPLSRRVEILREYFQTAD